MRCSSCIDCDVVRAVVARDPSREVVRAGRRAVDGLAMRCRLGHDRLEERAEENSVRIPIDVSNVATVGGSNHRNAQGWKEAVELIEIPVRIA